MEYKVCNSDKSEKKKNKATFKTEVYILISPECTAATPVVD